MGGSNVYGCNYVKVRVDVATCKYAETRALWKGVLGGPGATVV